MTLFMIGLIVSLLFVFIVHYLIRPFVKILFEKHEPFLFHIEYKVRRKWLKFKAFFQRD